MLDGQLPDPARPGAAVIDQDLAAREHLRPGGTLHLLMIPNGKNGVPDLGRARAMSFRVTGIAVFDSQIVPATKVNAEPTVLLSPGFYASAAARASTYGTQAGVRLRPGVSVASFAHAAAALAASYPATGGVIVVSLQDEAAATQRAISPQAVALALFAVGTLAHVLVTAVRQRRRDLALLKTLGLVRRQVLSVVEWQALSLAAVALVIGVPLGLLAGRWAWVLFASSAGLAPAASIPLALVLLTIPVTAALAAGLAVGPGRAAARVRAGVVLRAE